MTAVCLRRWSARPHIDSRVNEQMPASHYELFVELLFSS